MCYRKSILRIWFVPLLAWLISACSPRIATELTCVREPLDKFSKVGVLDVNSALDVQADTLGSLRVKGLRTGYPTTMDAVSAKARKAGGNVVALTSLEKNWLTGTYLEGEVLHVNNIDSLSFLYTSAPVNPIEAYDMKRFEVSLGTGTEAFFASEEFPLGMMDVWYLGPSSVVDLYEGCYDVNISVTVSAEWAYNLNYRWALVGSFGGNRVRAQYFDPISGIQTHTETTYMFDILAGARYRYIHFEKFSLYSQLQLGYTFHTPGEYWNRNKKAQNQLGWQITGLGITVGRDLFFQAEGGWGSEYFAQGMIPGIRLGIGYKF